MATITGNTKAIIGTVSQRPVRLRAASFPIVIGNVLLEPGEVTVRPNAVGFWQQVLARGTYELSLEAENGQTARCLIDVPDDSNTYSFDQRIISALPNLQAPVGGAQPTASAATLGLVKTDETVVDPVVPTGWFWKADYAGVRAIPNRQNNKICAVTSTKEFWNWNGASLAADNNSSVLKPDDTAAGSPGRWELGTVGGGAGLFQPVATRLEMKGVDPAVVKAVMVTEPEEPGVHVFYYFDFGNTDPADNINVVLPNAPYDALGKWVGRL